MGKRARYYHSQIDMELLLSGLSYAELPDTYVIFICDFDPFGRKKYRYTQKKNCKEVQDLFMGDGAHTIFLSTKGENADEVPQELVCFLEYVGAPLSESDRDYEDGFVRKLQNAVQEVKASREMGARYMTFQELLNDERAQGRSEGIAVGRAEEREALIKKLSENMTLEDIAHMLEEEVGVIAEIVNTP